MLFGSSDGPRADDGEPALLRVSIYVQSPRSPAGSPSVFVSLRATGANHKCLHHRAGDRPVEGGDWGGEGRGVKR
jgi:hypothetical protein